MKIRYIGALLLTVVILIAAVAFGLIPRMSRQKALLAASDVERERVPVVDTVVVRSAAATSDLVLPGNVEPMLEAPIYARADGYLRKLYVDIGDRVKVGQALADIETPELDQQLQQARASVDQAKAALKQSEAAVAQARANLALAKVTLERWRQLVSAGVMAKQDGDEKQAAFDARQADLEAALANVAAAQSNIRVNESNVKRLAELTGFGQVTAPFDGIITVRNTTTGTLISAGTNSPNRELLREAQIDVLRIFISVPQTNVAAIQVKMAADVTVQELPNRVFHGFVARTANALDATSRTLRTEVHVQNPDHTLLPGMYGQVKFSSARRNAPPLIPGDTLLIRSNGMLVALLGPDRKVHFQKIEVGRDYGHEIEVLSGLAEGQVVIVNPTDEIKEGVVVQPRK
ncbi:MAG TPA: efflux RND transporter periplasmic adaptor subunit [Bryobacteraceae bacterium]|nr:efflux RND transporter periplasmic adaptor subunit [Bryobacteraceae bacterium]